MSNLIKKGKKNYICEKLINCDSSREIFHLSNQMMGLYSEVLSCIQTFLQSLPDKFSDFFVCKIEQARSSVDPHRPIPTDTVEFSGTVFAGFQLIINDCVKKVLQEMLPKSLVTSTQFQSLFFMIVWMRLLLYLLI